MLMRCNEPKCTSYDRYGARGIKVCKRWHRFENFYKDMGERPPNKSLDRINNSRGYSKSNCRWSDNNRQSRNKRNNIIFILNGHPMIAKDAAKATGISYKVLLARIKSNTPHNLLFSKKDLRSTRSGRKPYASR
jgi:hypothetical protein